MTMLEKRWGIHNEKRFGLKIA